MIEEYLKYEKQYGRAIALPFFAGLVKSRHYSKRELFVFQSFLKSYDNDWELFWNLIFITDDHK